MLAGLHHSSPQKYEIDFYLMKPRDPSEENIYPVF
jgi:hypothetical protein